MPVTTTRPRRTDVRSRILEAAAAAFLEHGYAATTVADIATAAGFTKGAVYSNYGGKPELFVAACVARYSSVAGTVLASGTLGPEHSHAEVVDELCRSLAEQATLDTAWPTALAEFRALASRDPEVAEVYSRLRLQQRGDLEAQLRTHAPALGLTGRDDLAAVAHLVLTCFNAWSVEHVAAPEATPRALIADSFRLLLTRLTA